MRERLRPDRTVGMAAAQFDLVHDGVDYDIHVDATQTSSRDCAMQVISNLR
ncbi:MAG: chloramphenicol phosphotransferase CPT family protein [Frankiaceae bacterium]|nr:chloramphenicol phosphotransferase CPT family protein [Frankiaceae bacterium]